MILHRTRGQGFNGPAPISLETCLAFLKFWPQLDELKFVETMLVADQQLLSFMAKDREEKETKGKK